MGEHPAVGRDHEYARHGAVTLMAGMDLVTGHVHRVVSERHRSREFVEFLRGLDEHYPAGAKLRLILDNHSAHVSKETRAYLATVPNRFEFVFTPKHASWLNLIETFFSKVARTVLRGIRVESKDKLKERIERYIDELNAEPVVFKWTYGIDDAVEAWPECYFRNELLGVPAAERAERVRLLRRLIGLFEGHDAEDENRRLKEQDDGF